MNKTSTFDFMGIQLRVVLIDGNPWFVAKDIFEALDYPKGSRSYQTQQLGENERGVVRLKTPGGWQNLQSISESGLYKLAMRSDKWDASTFLTSIRARLSSEEKMDISPFHLKPD